MFFLSVFEYFLGKYFNQCAYTVYYKQLKFQTPIPGKCASKLAKQIREKLHSDVAINEIKEFAHSRAPSSKCKH